MTSEEDDWQARVPRQFGTKREDKPKPAGDASSKQGPKSSPQRYS